MKIINTISWVVAVGVAASLAMIVPVFAQTSASVGAKGEVGMQGGVRDGANGVVWRGGTPGGGIFGTVSAVNGDILTVNAAPRPARPMPEEAAASVGEPTVVAGTAYTVNATNAKIYKGSATTTVFVSAITVGDTVMIQGTVSGMNVAATVIRDGVSGRPGMPGKGLGRDASSTPIINGNGEPVVGGSITAISGTMLTVTNTSNVTYTINAASSTVVVRGVSSTLANIVVGDNVIVQGTVNGNSVTASSIIDQGAKAANASSTNGQSHGDGFGAGFGMRVGGFFGAIGGFFQHLFGF